MKTEKNGNPIVALIILGLFLAGFLVYNAIIAIGDMQTGKQRQVDIVVSKETLTVKHSLNLIPTGKDHYYLGVTSEGAGYIIRADEKWYKDNFDSEGKVKKAALQVSGPVRSLKTKYHRGFDQTFSEMQSAFPDGYYVYIYKSYLVEDVLRFAFIALTIICVICFAIGLKGKKLQKDYAFRDSAGYKENPKPSAAFNIGLACFIFAVLIMAVLAFRFNG